MFIFLKLYKRFSTKLCYVSLTTSLQNTRSQWNCFLKTLEASGIAKKKLEPNEITLRKKLESSGINTKKNSNLVELL